MKKYTIDIRWMLGSFRGMGRYAWQLIAPIKDDVIGLAPKNHECSGIPIISKGNSFFPCWEQFLLPQLAKKTQADYLICPYNTAPIFLSKKIKLVLVVHDLIFMRNFKELPLSVSLYQTLGRFYRRLIVPRLIRKADYIITVSNFTKSEIEQKYIRNENVFVIPNAISSEWLNQDIKPLSERDDFFLTVAGEAPSKNLATLIKAFSLYQTKNNNNTILKIVGVKPIHQGEFIKLAKAYSVNDKIEFLDFISNTALQQLYQSTRGFIFASLFEGFGIPLIEAMASGAPIACSNTTSLPEVVDNSAYLFSPTNLSEILHAFLYFDSQVNLLEERITNGLKRSQQFSEMTINQQFIKFWNFIDEKKDTCSNA